MEMKLCCFFRVALQASKEAEMRNLKTLCFLLCSSKVRSTGYDTAQNLNPYEYTVEEGRVEFFFVTAKMTNNGEICLIDCWGGKRDINEKP